MTIKFTWAANKNWAMYDNSMNKEVQSIEVEEGYTFEDYLNDNDVDFEEENGTYYVIEFGERTGEAFMVL